MIREEFQTLSLGEYKIHWQDGTINNGVVEIIKVGEVDRKILKCTDGQCVGYIWYMYPQNVLKLEPVGKETKMTKEEFNALVPGAYRIHWTNGTAYPSPYNVCLIGKNNNQGNYLSHCGDNGIIYQYEHIGNWIAKLELIEKDPNYKEQTSREKFSEYIDLLVKEDYQKAEKMAEQSRDEDFKNLARLGKFLFDEFDKIKKS